MTKMTTRTHAVLDYMTAPTLMGLPRMMDWGPCVTRLFTASGLGMLGYSLLTRYELGAYKVLPMRTHLTLDLVAGAALCAAPLMIPEEEREPGVTAAMLGFGLFEVAASFLTEPEPRSLMAPAAPSQGQTAAATLSMHQETIP